MNALGWEQAGVRLVWTMYTDMGRVGRKMEMAGRCGSWWRFEDRVAGVGFACVGIGGREWRGVKDTGSEGM